MQGLCTAHKCDDLWQCMVSSGCAVQRGFDDPFMGVPGIEFVNCYCGNTDTTNFPGCFAATDPTNAIYPHGACKKEFEALAGQQDPSAIGSLFNDSSSPIGALYSYVNCANVNSRAYGPL